MCDDKNHHGVRRHIHSDQTGRDLNYCCVPAAGSGSWYLDQKLFTKKVMNLAVYIWSIKYRGNKKLIIQFACKLRDEHFEPN
jgi:hypothetical protein